MRRRVKALEHELRMTREMYRESAPLATSAEEMVATEAAEAAAAAATALVNPYAGPSGAPYISPYLAISPHISPYLPISPYQPVRRAVGHTQRP